MPEAPLRLWVPSGAPTASVATSGVGFGKDVVDMAVKGFNGDAWKLEAYAKRGAPWCADAVGVVKPGAASMSAAVDYTHASTGVKYRGTTDHALKHTSEVAYELPQEGDAQRVKLAVSAELDKDTFLPKGEGAQAKAFWRITRPQHTVEAMLQLTQEGAEGLSVWGQGEVSDDVAWGGMVDVSLRSSTLRLWEAGLLAKLHVAAGAFTARVLMRTTDAGTAVHAGVLTPPHGLPGTDLPMTSALFLSAEGSSGAAAVAAAKVDVTSRLSVKAQMPVRIQGGPVSVSATWALAERWKASLSIAGIGTARQALGVRFTQGSSPAPL